MRSDDTGARRPALFVVAYHPARKNARFVCRHRLIKSPSSAPPSLLHLLLLSAAGLMMASSAPIESSRIAPYISVSASLSPSPRLPSSQSSVAGAGSSAERFSSSLMSGSHYLGPYGADPALLAAAHHYSTANQGKGRSR